MNYQKHYDLLISRGQSRILEGYSEKHHVIPKCMGGNNSEDNLVRLTPEEHYLAHQLLVKIYPEIPGLVYAVWMMTINSNQIKRYNNKLYGWIRKKHSTTMSEKMTGRTKETHPGVRASAEKRTGRTKETCLGLKATSEKLTGRTKETHAYIQSASEKKSKTTKGRTKETHPGVRASAEKRTGRTKETHEYLRASSEKISETLSGRTKETHEYLRASSEKISEKLTGRTKETHEYLLVRSEKLTGRTKETHEYLRLNGAKTRKLSDEQEQILFDMRESGIPGKEIVEYFKKLDFHIAYSSISGIYNRIKREKIIIKFLI